MVKVLRGDGKVHDDYKQSFTLADLSELEAVLEQAAAVIPMIEAVTNHDPAFVAMRHDIDHDPDHAVKFARWEHARGFRSTYFMLHSAWYWNDIPRLFRCMDEIVSLGHEVGLHYDGIGMALEEGAGDYVGRAFELIYRAVTRLRDRGYTVQGCVAHGSRACSDFGIPNEVVWHEHDLSELGFVYEGYFEHRKDHAQYHSDNGGRWHRGGNKLDVVTPPSEWPLAGREKQPHILVHPCHWVIPS